MICTTRPSTARKNYGFGEVAIAVAIIAVLGISAVWAADVIMVSQRDRKFSPDRIEFARGSMEIGRAHV